MFLDDYSHINREFDYFHPKHEECCDECEFCHEEPSVLDAIHGSGDFDAQTSNAHGFACVVGYLFGIK